MNMTMEESRKSREPQPLAHNWVSGHHPYESKWHCTKCGTCKTYAWWRGELEGGHCDWVKIPDKGDIETACERCGHCDCADGHHGEAQLCKEVGECSGIWYDIYYNEHTDECICADCWAALNV